MDRITRVRIQNVRAIASLELELSKGITVLIGENGAGKSTILECLELLRRAAEPNFLSQFYEIHRGMPALLRKGATSLTLGVTVEDDAGDLPRLDYDLTLAKQGAGARITNETLVIEEDESCGQPRTRVVRDEAEIRVYPPPSEVRSDPLPYQEDTWLRVFVNSLGNSDPLINSPHSTLPDWLFDRLRETLQAIEVHLGFDTRASWAARAYQRPESLRVGMTHRPATRLGLLGGNLANAWSELRNRPSDDWEHTLSLVRLGLGEQVDGVLTIPDAGGGNIYLALRFRGLDEPIFATDLSDGQLSWLAFVAMTQLNQGRSLLAIDEPELHMHPALLGRVMALLSAAEADTPTLVSTHADRVLSMLDDPAEAVRVCGLDGNRVTVARLDEAELPRWIEQFGDLGQIRAAGYLSRVVAGPPPRASEEAP